MTFEDRTPARLVFANDPLRVVVAQVRFARTPLLHDESVLAEIHRRLPDLPEMVPPPRQVDVPLPGGARFAFSQQGPAQFRDPVASTVVSVTPETVSVETNDYPGWSAFAGRMRSVLTALDDLLPQHITRLGLRYVNELFVPGAETPADWERLLDPSLVASVSADRLFPRVRQSLQQVVLDMDDAHEITLRHGFVRRADLPGEAPSSLYLFDIDAYNEAPAARDTAGILAQLTRYHDWTWALFRGSIRDELIAAMGGEPA